MRGSLPHELYPNKKKMIRFICNIDGAFLDWHMFHHKLLQQSLHTKVVLYFLFFTNISNLDK